MTPIQSIRQAMLAVLLSLTALTAAAQVPDPGRVHIMDGLADPDIAFDGARYLLTGTWEKGRNRTIKVWSSTSLDGFREAAHYDPSKVDKRFDYCRIWAPDLSVDGDRVVLAFSAMRHAEGTPCTAINRPPENAQVTTFVATASRAALKFGVPKPINAGTQLPRTITSARCPAQGCNHAIRIDAAVHQASAGDWFFYTWFTKGNNISAYPMGRPDRVYDILRPFPNYDNPFSSVQYEETINEAPDVITRNGLSYLIYSRGNAHRAYGLSYLIADNVARFSKEQGVHSLSTPAFAEIGPGCVAKNGAANYMREPLVENLGHSSAIEYRGRYYIFYHVGRWTGEGCAGFERTTYRQALNFRPDGTLESLTDLFVVWSGTPGQRYSLDLRLKNGRWIAPCVGADVLGSTPSYRFTGACPSATGRDRIVHKSQIDRVRMVASRDGDWTDGRGESALGRAYSGGDYLLLDQGKARGSGVSITWTGTGRRGESYSLEAILKNGRVVSPCLTGDDLGNAHAVRFDGTCRAGMGRVNLSQVSAFRICSSAAWMNMVRENVICIREPYRGGDRVHIDMGGG